MQPPRRPQWWGSKGHVVFTVVVFIVLASLDNAAAALIPAMVLPVAETLDTSETALVVMTGLVILVTALTAVAWGYAGDRSSRKRLLFVGTLIWSLGAFVSAGADAFWQLFAGQMILAVGLGSIASVGFAVVSDFVAPRRRGLAMSFWGLSQGLGGLVGGLLASQLGANNFRAPLTFIAFAGLLFAMLYLFTFDAPRGYAEPQLDTLHEAGIGYEYRIEPEDVPALFRKKTNVWLIIQGFSAQFAYGSLIWVGLLYQEKVLAEGYDVATATKVGGLLGAIFQIGALFSILAGYVGDRLQAKNLSARALLSAAGILGAIPFFLVFFFIPLTGLQVTNGATTAVLIPEVLLELVANPYVAAAFVTSVLGLALTSADSPNWFALISDINLPEHRGTIFGLGNLANGIGRASGNALVGALAGSIERAFPPPLNWAVGLATFQIFFLPTGWCYWQAAKTSPGDITATRDLLTERAIATAGETSS